MAEYIANHWMEIILLIVVTVEVATMLKRFSDKPTSEKIAMLKEWLLYAVAEAERELGQGTGQLKLRFVYDMALRQFPFLTMALSFDKFSDLVDEALDRFRAMLSGNTDIQSYVDTTDA